MYFVPHRFCLLFFGGGGLSNDCGQAVCNCFCYMHHVGQDQDAFSKTP